MNSELDALARDYWQGWLDANPTEAHLLGHYPRGEGRFEDSSRAAEDAEIERLRDVVARAEAIEVDQLDDAEQITRQVLLANAGVAADLKATRLAEISADPIFGLQTAMPLILGMLNLPDAEVAEAMPGVLSGLGETYRQLGDRHREGIARGWAPPAFAVEGVIAQIEEALAVPLDDDPLVASLKLPDHVGTGEDPDFDEAAWRQRLRSVVEGEVRPGLVAYRDVLRDEVAPSARPDDKVGLTWLEGGDDAYAATLRYFTTTDLDAQAIHDIGLRQIEQLAEEYRELGATALGTSDLAEIFDRMRSDPKLHFTDGEQLVTESKAALARAWEAMGDWFETLPQAPCAVEGTTTGAKAFYFPPAADGSRGGTFFIQIEDPESWGTFELEAMAFHEGIPGHHLQLAIAAELPDSLPEFRRFEHNSAYAEGWGLYSERLSDEMGLYGSEIDRLGMLAADSMRACRLVVDTGLHALGWSRQQAVQYMVDNSPLTPSMCEPEIDRYIVSPGQACSYMIGRLEIQRLRREAEERQGSDFAIKDFHTAVLDNGSLPLGVLESVVAARLP